MAFAARSGYRFLAFDASRGIGHARGVTPRLGALHAQKWHYQDSIFRHSYRYYSGSAGTGSAAPNWSGLVYSFTDNLQGKVKLGPACFHRDGDDDDSEEENKKRDMRDEVPLRINRPWLRMTAEAIQLRLLQLADDVDDTDEYRDMMELVRLLERLAAKESDDPLLEFEEYKEIWDTVRAANFAEAEFRLPMFSVTEKGEIARIYAIAGALYRVAALNAALRGVRGERHVSQDESGLDRDHKSLALNIYGGVLDGKDFFGNDKWFTKEEDLEMLKVINQLRAESRKRGSDWG